MIKQLQATYSGKRVFLTGHTGFKGSWMLKVLSLLGAEIKGYSLSPEFEYNLYNLINGDTLNDSVIADIRDKENLKKAIIDFQPDFIFHLAAQPLVRLSYQIPAETFEVNAVGTANVLDSIRYLNKPCQVIIITTDKVYHNQEWEHPYKETDRLGGYDPYSASKACAELVIDSYRNSFFNPSNYSEHAKAIAVTRAGNVIGGGDWAKDRLIPDIVRALSQQQEVTIRNPNAVRPWQHVLEPVIGYLILGEKLLKSPLLYSSAYNFGPHLDDAMPVSAMVDLAIKAWGSGNFKNTSAEHQPHEAGLLKLDINKASVELGWSPKYNAQTAIDKTIAWYKNYVTNPEEVINFTENQVKDFISA